MFSKCHQHLLGTASRTNPRPFSLEPARLPREDDFDLPGAGIFRDNLPMAAPPNHSLAD
jgi:hypothetical protein